MSEDTATRMARVMATARGEAAQAWLTWLLRLAIVALAGWVWKAEMRITTLEASRSYFHGESGPR